MIIGNELLSAFTLISAIGCGLIGGIFFIFSVCIMKALSRLPAEEGIAAMQSINITIVNPVFLLVFLGTAATSVLAIISSLLSWQNSAAVYLLVGGVLYLVGGIFVTAVFNVPKNNALDAIKRTDPTRASFWADYLSSWTIWNHVRTITVLAAAISFAIALGL